MICFACYVALRLFGSALWLLFYFGCLVSVCWWAGWFYAGVVLLGLICCGLEFPGFFDWVGLLV